MQKARRHRPKSAPTGCKHTVSGSISLRYSRYFSPFPHGTGSLSVSQEYLALPDGAGKFTQGSSNPALLRIPLARDNYTYTGLSPSAVRLSNRILILMQHPQRGPITPARPKSYRFGLVRVRSPLLTESLIIFFSYGYLDVSVPHVRLPFGMTIFDSRVAPFGNPRVKGRLHLPAAYRS
jgi:hypothetical protein